MRTLFVIGAMALSSCATISKRETVRIPIRADQAGAWVEVDGVRSNLPAVVAVNNSTRTKQLSIGAPGKRAVDVVLEPEFQWQTLYFGLMGLVVDAANGNAWQLPVRQIDVDFDSETWTNSPERAAYIRAPQFHIATRKRNWGVGLTSVGAITGLAGSFLMMSGICYEGCGSASPDAAAERRLAAGAGLAMVGGVALVTGIVLWVGGSRARSRSRETFLDAPTFP